MLTVHYCPLFDYAGLIWAVTTAGLGSAVGEVAALAVDTLSKLVNAAGAAQVRPLLPDVVPPLLESLSTLEVLNAHMLHSVLEAQYSLLRLRPMAHI